MKLHIEDYDGDAVCRCGSLNLTTDPAMATCSKCKGMWKNLKKTGYARVSEHPEDYEIKSMVISACDVLKEEKKFYSEMDERLAP